MILAWRWDILQSGQIWSFVSICMKKKMEIIYFLKTIAAYDLKIGRCTELNDLIKLHEYHRSRSLFDLRQRSLSFQT